MNNNIIVFTSLLIVPIVETRLLNINDVVRTLLPIAKAHLMNINDQSSP